MNKRKKDKYGSFGKVATALGSSCSIFIKEYRELWKWYKNFYRERKNRKQKVERPTLPEYTDVGLDDN